MALNLACVTSVQPILLYVTLQQNYVHSIAVKLTTLYLFVQVHVHIVSMKCHGSIFLPAPVFAPCLQA